MSTLNLTLDRHLARTVALTGRLKNRPRRSRALTQMLSGLDFFARGIFYAWRNRRYLSTVKLLNMALVNLQFKLKTQYVFGRPYKMKIESTNICNTHCQLCPTGIGLEGRPKGKMTMGQFQRLIDQFRWHLVAIDLSMWGDPLIVPDIYDMIRYAHDRRIWTYISSNLHAFKPGKGQTEKLVESGLDLLTCSFHGATQETYEIYQPGKRLDECLEKIKHVLAVRDRMGSKLPGVQLNFVVTRYNEHEQEAFSKLADGFGVKAVFSWAALNTRFIGKDQRLQTLGLAPDLIAKQRNEHIRQWLPRGDEHRLEIYARMLDGEWDPQQFNGSKLFNCSWPWQQSVINWDGQAVTCCGSFETNEDMGSVFDTSFGKIWNSRKYRLARKSFRKKLSDEQAKNNPCATCPGIML